MPDKPSPDTGHENARSETPVPRQSPTQAETWVPEALLPRVQSALLGARDGLLEDRFPSAPPEEIARRLTALDALLEQLAAEPAQERLQGRKVQGDIWELQDAVFDATAIYFAQLSETAEDLAMPRGGLALVAELLGGLGAAEQLVRLVESVGVPSRPRRTEG